MKKIAVIGSTGSIGVQTLSVIRRYPERFKVVSLAAGSSFSTVRVYSDDEYNASLSEDEVMTDRKAYLIEDDGTIRLIVFGDKDSKRDVKSVVRIEIE